MERLWITAMAVLWGTGTSLLIPRAAYRLSVPPEEPWRTACPAGHPLAGIADGWLGRACCADKDAFGPSTPAIALVTAGACAVLAAADGDRPELLVWLLLAPIAVLLAPIDFAVHRMPDVATLPLAVTALVGLGGAACCLLLAAVGGLRCSALLHSAPVTSCCS